ncbi:MAG: hypothetical protein AB1599_03365 [Planctomycetota bacterium]
MSGEWKVFQDRATEIMGKHFGVNLGEKNPTGFPKRFDMVSPDEDIIGDAKFLTLVKGERVPPAKFMEIAGHMWLLEKVNAKRRFLVFGNQREVAEWWLEKYGNLVSNVEFYFIGNNGVLEKLK